MNYKLIMLPNPILVGDEKISHDYDKPMWNVVHNKVFTSMGVSLMPDFKKIIAGIEGLPILDLSAIAEEIGLVDVEKLVEQEYEKEPNNDFLYGQSKDLQSAYKAGVWDGFKAAQSLNEKKYSEEDMRDMFEFGKHFSMEDFGSKYFEERLQQLSKPKEYQVEVEMEDMLQKRHGVQWYDLPNQKEGREPDGIYQTVKRIKITNNTIKITKILS